MGSSTTHKSKDNPGKSKEKSREKEEKKSKESKKVTPPPESSSEEESESEEESSSASEEEESSSSEEEESGSESEEVKETTEQEKAKPAGALRAAEVFALPDGFTEVDNERSNNPFSADRLKGKQIWLFTAPVGVPLSEVKKFKIEHLSRRKPVVEVKGKKFCLREEDAVEEAGTQILLPSEKSKGRYVTAPVPVSKCIRLEEYVELPSLPTEEQLLDKRTKPAPTQPKGLKMRYRPFGAAGNVSGGVSDSEDDNDVEMKDADASAPRTIVNGETRRKEKRRISEHGDEARKKVRFDADVVDSPSKERKHKSKEKKKHREKSSA